MLTYGCHRIIHVIFYRTFYCQIALKCQNNCLVNRADECYVLELIQTIDKKSLEIKEKRANVFYPFFLKSHAKKWDRCPFNLQPEKWFEGYPDFSRVHPAFSRVQPRPDFSRVLTWFLVWNPVFFKLPPWKKPGRSYPKKFQTEPKKNQGAAAP